MFSLLFLNFTSDAPALLAATPMPVLVGLFSFIYGACIGSFANAASLRLLQDEDPISQPSRCRFCDRKLRIFENIPIIGYLLLWGRCGCKKQSLPFRYLFIELGVGCLFLAYAACLPLWACLALSCAAAIMSIAFLTDLSGMVLWTSSLLFGAVAGIIAAVIIPAWPVSVLASAFGSLVGAGLIFISNIIYKIARGTQGFGTGDVWLMGMIGAWFGPIGAITIFFGGAYLGAILGISLILLGQRQLSSKLPFGVFLSIVFLLYPIIYILFN